MGRGTLIVIGGGERDQGSDEILRRVARAADGGKLVVAAVASPAPEETGEKYERVFRRLGVRHVHKLAVQDRLEAKQESKAKVLRDATVVFFTGGDQLRITSQIGDSLVYERIQEIFAAGGTIAGTSAGAAALSETMLVSGDGDSSHRIGSALRLAPGLGLVRGIIFDQHFAERGRMGRLLGAVAQNPAILGVGIDENTAVVVAGNRTLEVIGEGAVYVVDGSGITHSNLSEEEPERVMSLFDVRLHVLSANDRFDLRERRPRPVRAEAAASAP